MQITQHSSSNDFSLVSESSEKLANKGTIEERGAINTKLEVVTFILDLIGYTEDKPLTDYRLLEPSFGCGDFLLLAINRLLVSAKRDNKLTYEELKQSISAIELHHDTYENTRELVVECLHRGGLSKEDAGHLTNTWLFQGDFLLSEFDPNFSHVVGNPPYVRQESIPDILMTEYRRRYRTIYDRSDIYVPFIEHSLSLLANKGKLGFICANRWLKNKYGMKLRELISNNYSLTIYVDMIGTNAFHTKVSAYPAITVIKNEKNPITHTFDCTSIDKRYLKSIAKELTGSRLPKKGNIQSIENVAVNSEPWIIDSMDKLGLVRRLEAEFPSIEEAGCKIGIGVATGADKVFIGNYNNLDVEPTCKLPLVMTSDIQGGQIIWKGKGIINPFDNEGKLVDLNCFPKLRRFLDTHKEQIANRHIAKKNPKTWYRTIDRIHPSLTYREKLLIPDINDGAKIVYEKGKLYPHHNLYYLTSDDWDIKALHTVMNSGIAQFFVSLYCTRMRGGYFRFQAQYLRKIRIPRWQDVSVELRKRLFQYSEFNKCHNVNEIVSELYGLTTSELKLIQDASER